MKKRLIALIGIAFSIQTAQAGLSGLIKKAKETAGQAKTLVDQAKALVEPSKEYKAGSSRGEKGFTPISVEIKNKGEDIWVAVKTGGSFATAVTKVAAGATQPFEVAITAPYEIYVWNREPASKDDTSGKVYSFAANETAYVTADKGGSLRPQTGPAEGRLKKTDTGLSLSRNVTKVLAASSIIYTPEKKEPEVVNKTAEPVKPTPAKVPEAPATVSKEAPSAPPLPPAAPTKKPAPDVKKPVETKPAIGDRSDLLAQIRAGKQLNKVSSEEVETKKPTKSESQQTVSDILQNSPAFKKRTAANSTEAA